MEIRTENQILAIKEALEEADTSLNTACSLFNKEIREQETNIIIETLQDIKTLIKFGYYNTSRILAVKLINSLKTLPDSFEHPIDVLRQLVIELRKE